MAVQTINVPIGPAIVEFGEGANLTKFDITKGGITFQMSTSTQEVQVDQYGDTVVKEIMKGRTAEVKVPFALSDLERLSKVMPNSKLTKSGTGATAKIRLDVNSTAGFDMLSIAKKLVIKPTDPLATANDWITIPVAGPSADIEYAYNADNERIANITFKAYPDVNNGGLLFTMGDETVTVA